MMHYLCMTLKRQWGVGGTIHRVPQGILILGCNSPPVSSGRGFVFTAPESLRWTRDSLAAVEKHKVLECEPIMVFPLFRGFKCVIIFLIVHLSASISDSRYSYIMQKDNRRYTVVFEE